ncbi:MAG: polyprenyl synthetase family protein [Bacteroidales bacterium]|nr:polyprenyl synthetase family protein [Candidatus Colimorpha onthohippi]
MNLDNTIFTPIADLLIQFNDMYRIKAGAHIPILEDVNDYLLQQSGKHLRPMLLLLAGGGNNPDRLVQLAVAMEMLHNASLMHDDVVDESNERRGKPSLNCRWGNQIAVLTGDYYLAQVITILFELNDTIVSKRVADTVVTMCEGELLQQRYLHSACPTREEYIDVIYKKTAALMQTCCFLGNPQFDEFGRRFGLAFQVRDDIDDYGQDDVSALPPLSDLHELLKQQVDLALQLLANMPQTPYTHSLTLLTEALLP